MMMMVMDQQMKQMKVMLQELIFLFLHLQLLLLLSNINETTSSATINFTHHVDNIDELDKYVELTVSLAVGETDATVASDGTQTQIIKLQDDDDPMQLSFSSSTDENPSALTTETITVYAYIQQLLLKQMVQQILNLP